MVLYEKFFGNLKPAKELLDYLDVDTIHYNYETFQKYDTFICGHLCLKFLAGQLI